VVLPGKRDSASVGSGLGASAPNFTVGASVLPLEYRHSGSCHGGERRLGEGDHWGPRNPQGLQARMMVT
jgi:hypothetical protein